MRILLLLPLLVLSFFSCTQAQEPTEKTTFQSKDGLKVTADLYEKEGNTTYLLLCHQAGFSRGEYVESAQQLLALGFNCMAIDQRSGKEANGVTNETAKRAAAKKLSTNYIDAQQDIEAAIDFLWERNGNKPIILVGSSYSASLVLMIAKGNPKVAKVAAFSPGEYYRSRSIADEISGLEKPVFVTSSKSEAPDLKKLIRSIDDATQFIPVEGGKHGSKALWKSTSNHAEYWTAFKQFLAD